MVDIVFRTTNSSHGAGVGRNLHPEEVDQNFENLKDAVEALQADPPMPIGIDHFEVIGNSMYVHMEDLNVLGPYTLPVASWRYRSEGWLAEELYAAMDLFSQAGSLYLVLVAHESAMTFDPGAQQGGDDLYLRVVQAPVVYQRISFFVPGVPDPGTILARYVFDDNVQLPDDLVGSVASSAASATGQPSYSIELNGSVVGSIDFDVSDGTVGTFTFTNSQVCSPGDVLTVLSPSPSDATHADISVTLRALVE